jgi:hypothetical protein
MHRILTVIAIVLAALVGVWTATAAATTVALHVNPTTVAAGTSVQVSGQCDPNTGGYVISTAFLHDATHDFAGVGAVPFTTDSTGAFAGTALIPSTRAAGTYQVTGRCGGGNLGISVTLTVVAPGGGTPTGVNAGSGGLAASTGTSTLAWQVGLGGVGLVLLTIGLVSLVRRRRGARL